MRLVPDKFLREASKHARLDYDAQLKDYHRFLSVRRSAKPHASSGRAKSCRARLDPGRADVPSIVSLPQQLFRRRQSEESGNKKVRVVYGVHDRESGISFSRAALAWLSEKDGERTLSV